MSPELVQRTGIFHVRYDVIDEFLLARVQLLVNGRDGTLQRLVILVALAPRSFTIWAAPYRSFHVLKPRSV